MPEISGMIQQFLEGNIKTLSAEPMIESKTITENGTYTAPEGVDGYSPVVVNVPSTEPVIESKNISENGTYTAPEGVDGYSPVIVNVPLPENTYLIKTATTSMSDAEQLPVASAVVSVTDKDKAELFLTSDGVVSEDNSPYTYRPSPSGNSCVDLSVVGGTVAWNQLVQSTDTSCTVPNTHKYIFHHGTTYDVAISDGTAFTVDGSANDNVHDIIQAFGSTIADYIYSLEQATAGSGIAWLKSYGFLTKDYYAYQSGKLESVNVASRKIVGFNVWDEEWITGYYRNGIFVYGTDAICCKNKIRVMPNTTYYLYKASSANFFYTFYDANGLFLSLSGYDSQGRYQMVSSGAISVPNDAYYMTFNMGSAYGSTYNNDICINISDPSKNGTYEPYKEYTYDLSGSHNVVRKFKVVNMGDLSWTNRGNNIFSTLLNDASRVTSAICAKYATNNVDATTLGSLDKTMSTLPSYNYKTIMIRDTSYSTEASFKSSLNNVYLVYELETPTTETVINPELRGVLKLDANNKLYYYGDTMGDIPNPQLVGSTEEFVDAGTSASTPTRDVDIPVGQDSKYVNGNIYIKYLDSVTTGDIELADEYAIIPLENTTYISSNGSASIDYWSKEV